MNPRLKFFLLIFDEGLILFQVMLTTFLKLLFA
jgi:hypothetical protein